MKSLHPRNQSTFWESFLTKNYSGVTTLHFAFRNQVRHSMPSDLLGGFLQQKSYFKLLPQMYTRYFITMLRSGTYKPSITHSNKNCCHSLLRPSRLVLSTALTIPHSENYMKYSREQPQTNIHFTNMPFAHLN